MTFAKLPFSVADPVSTRLKYAIEGYHYVSILYGGGGAPKRSFLASELISSFLFILQTYTKRSFLNLNLSSH